MSGTSSIKAVRNKLAHRVRVIVLWVGGVLAAMWFMELLDTLLLGSSLQRFGIRPRQFRGLACIPLAPFLHDDFAHLAANSAPFAVLGALILLRSPRHFVASSIIIVAVGGFGVWLVGSRSNHIGASGLIFGYFGFLVLRGWFERRISSAAIAIAVAVFYGGLIRGVLPGEAGVSWESHLCGFLSGCAASEILARRGSPNVTAAGRER